MVRMFDSNSRQMSPDDSLDELRTLGCEEPRTTPPGRGNVGRRVLGDRVEGAWRLYQEAEVMLADAVAEWDRGNAWAVDGALSASAWLRHRLGVGHGRAQGILSFSRGLAAWIDIADAVTEGVLSADKARQILAKFTEKRHSYAERDVQVIVEQAERLSVRECYGLMAAWAARVDAEIESENPDHPNPDPDGADAISELFVSEIGDGHVILNGSLGPELGETVRTALDLARKLGNGEDPSELPVDSEHIEKQPNREGEGAPAPDPAPDGPRDTRSQAEQRADALGLIVRFFLDHNGDIGTNAGSRPHVHVEIDLDVLEERKGGIARTQYGAYGLTAADVQRMCCDANISRIVTRGMSEILDVGRKTRVVPVATAKVIRRRDRGCRFPGCNVGSRFTEIHHKVHWCRGGTTDVVNLFLLCWRHHRMMHGKDAWIVSGNPNDILAFTSPNGDNYATGPPGVLV